MVGRGDSQAVRCLRGGGLSSPITTVFSGWPVPSLRPPLTQSTSPQAGTPAVGQRAEEPDTEDPAAVWPAVPACHSIAPGPWASHLALRASVSSWRDGVSRTDVSGCQRRTRQLARRLRSAVQGLTSGLPGPWPASGCLVQSCCMQDLGAESWSRIRGSILVPRSPPGRPLQGPRVSSQGKWGQLLHKNVGAHLLRPRPSLGISWPHRPRLPSFWLGRALTASADVTTAWPVPGRVFGRGCCRGGGTGPLLVLGSVEKKTHLPSHELASFSLTLLSWPHSWAQSALPTHVPALWSRLGLFGMASLGSQGGGWLSGLGSEPVPVTAGRLGSTTGEAAATVAGCGWPASWGLGGRGSRKALPLPSPHSRASPGRVPWVHGGATGRLPPPTVHAGPGWRFRHWCQALPAGSRALLCVLPPRGQVCSPHELALGMWLREEALVPVCVSGDFGALPLRGPRRALHCD